MRVVCGCGSQALGSSLDDRQCIKCGAPCCPACAFSLEEATSCSRCAESILDAHGVPLTHQPGPRDETGPALRRAAGTGGEHAQWFILVARDQADLYAHLVRAFPATTRSTS